MIKRFRSKALRDAFAGQLSKLDPAVAAKIVLILDVLDAAQSLQDLEALPGFHALKGDRAGQFAARVTANWRITWALNSEEVTDPSSGQTEQIFHVTRVDYEDYH